MRASSPSSINRPITVLRNALRKIAGRFILKLLPPAEPAIGLIESHQSTGSSFLQRRCGNFEGVALKMPSILSGTSMQIEVQRTLQLFCRTMHIPSSRSNGIKKEPA
jgi:hypothetical protein